MFVSSSEYERVATSIFEEEEEPFAAVAFWGHGAESIVHPRSGQRIKLICNLESGATNPSVIEALRGKKGVLLKQHDRLHAKVVLGSKRALIGSANFSSNGLNLEGAELSGWQEAGFLTSDLVQIGNIRKWFDDLWKKSRKITDSDLDKAKLQWKQRRAARPKHSHPSSLGFSLRSLQRPELLDRQIFVTIYGDTLSDEAKKAYRKYEERLSDQQTNKSVRLPPMYEDWPDLPKNAQLLAVYHGPRGALRCSGVFTRTHDIKFKHSDGSKGHLAVCRKDDHVMGYPFGAKEASQFAKDLRPCIGKILKNTSSVGDEGGRCIRLADVAAICAHT